jgi:hypothetical protein
MEASIQAMSVIAGVVVISSSQAGSRGGYSIVAREAYWSRIWAVSRPLLANADAASSEPWYLLRCRSEGSNTRRGGDRRLVRPSSFHAWFQSTHILPLERTRCTLGRRGAETEEALKRCVVHAITGRRDTHGCARLYAVQEDDDLAMVKGVGIGEDAPAH